MDFFFEQLARHGDRVALAGPVPVSYQMLLDRAAKLAGALDVAAGQRVALLAPTGPEAVVGLLALWHRGLTAVPLSPHHPPAEWDHVLGHARPAAWLVHPAQRAAAESVSAPHRVPLIDVGATGQPPQAHRWSAEEPALMLYTSGTTSRPKGVPLSAGNLQTHVEGLAKAWRWSSADRVPAFLPLHHVHGLINILTCGLYAGAAVILRERFDVDVLFADIMADRLSVVMAVPTIYHRIMARFDAGTPAEQQAFADAARRVRLWISGSAALDRPMYERFAEVTGQNILERYGMTEIGMALSNPYASDERRAGEVGQPLPWMNVRLVDSDGGVLEGDAEGTIQVAGPGVFAGYFENESATREAFTEDGWFVTGDVAARENGRYRILGRTSVDIIKSGGEKISALEIEAVLLGHPDVAECAVVGLPDEQWGQTVAAAVVRRPGAAADESSLQSFVKESLAKAKVPRTFVFVDELPRNAMGKVQKPQVLPLFAG